MMEKLSKDNLSIVKMELLLSNAFAADFKDEFKHMFESGEVEATDDVFDWLYDQVEWDITVIGRCAETNKV
jgi:hypothetical protein